MKKTQAASHGYLNDILAFRSQSPFKHKHLNNKTETWKTIYYHLLMVM